MARFLMSGLAILILAPSTFAAVQFALAGGGYVTAGDLVRIEVVREYGEEALSTLVIAIESSSRLPEVEAVGLLDASEKNLVYYASGDRLVLILYGSDTPIEASALFYIDFRIPDDLAEAGAITLSDAGSSGASPLAEEVTVQLSPASFSVLQEATPHSADTDGNFQIDLSELLRVIQFYNSIGYHCDSVGEDGFNPGTGAEDCTAHASDYTPQDWRISLSELLRLIQFYNFESGAYHPDAAGEDGFSPGAAAG